MYVRDAITSVFLPLKFSPTWGWTSGEDGLISFVSTKLRVRDAKKKKKKMSEEGVKGESNGSIEREEKEKEEWRGKERKVGERGSERRESNSPIPD